MKLSERLSKLTATLRARVLAPANQARALTAKIRTRGQLMVRTLVTRGKAVMAALRRPPMVEVTAKPADKDPVASTPA